MDLNGRFVIFGPPYIFCFFFLSEDTRTPQTPLGICVYFCRSYWILNILWGDDFDISSQGKVKVKCETFLTIINARFDMHPCRMCVFRARGRNFQSLRAAAENEKRFSRDRSSSNAGNYRSLWPVPPDEATRHPRNISTSDKWILKTFQHNRAFTIRSADGALLFPRQCLRLQAVHIFVLIIFRRKRYIKVLWTFLNHFYVI